MGAFFFMANIRRKNMFKINRYLYIDKNVRQKWEIFARKEEFADQLANRITALGVYNLRRVKIGFCKPVLVEIPPYELEQAQEDYVEECESKKTQRV